MTHLSVNLHTRFGSIDIFLPGEPCAKILKMLPGKCRSSRGEDTSVFIAHPGKELVLRKFRFIIAAQR